MGNDGTIWSRESRTGGAIHRDDPYPPRLSYRQALWEGGGIPLFAPILLQGTRSAGVFAKYFRTWPEVKGIRRARIQAQTATFIDGHVNSPLQDGKAEGKIQRIETGRSTGANL